MEERKAKYYKRVAETYGLETPQQGNDIVRLFSAMKKVSSYVDDMDSLCEKFIEKISIGESVIPRERDKKD